MPAWIIGIGITLLGAIICIFSIIAPRWNSRKNIDDYQRKTESLSKNQDKADNEGFDESTIEREEPCECSSRLNIGGIIGGFVAILIGVSLIGPISSEINSLNYINDSSKATNVFTNFLLEQVPLLFMVAIGLMAFGIVFSSLRDAGII